MGGALLAALLAAAGYGLLELAFFAQRNQLLPWKGEHAGLFLLFAVLHLAVALAAVALAAAARRALPFLGPAFPALAAPAALGAVHLVTWFRERFYALPRDVPGTLGSIGLALAPLAAAWILSRVLPRAAGRATAVAAAGAMLLLGAARVATVKPMGEEAPATPRPAADRLAAADTGQRVLVFGFDGATWDVLDPLIAAGRMPNLAALAARGRTFDLETIRPTFSPVIWTSVATGKSRFRHGIHDVVQTRLPLGAQLRRSIERTAFYTKTTGVVVRALDRKRLLALAPYRSGQVRATSVFEAASEAGLSTTQIEWYVSWPARRLSGVTVSDRFHLQETDEVLEGAVSPAALGEALLPHVVRGEDVPLERVLELVDTDGLDDAAARAWAREHGPFVEEMRLNLARDLSTRNVAVDLLSRDRDWRLFGVYFRAVDLTHHLTWRLRDAPGDPAADPELRLRTVIERYHVFMDGIVGDVLAHVPPDAVVVMVSDHGFEDRFAHSRAPDGFAILAGGPVVPSAERGRLSIYDVAPTVAALLGLPVAEDLDGAVRDEILAPDFRAAHPVRRVATWEREGREGDPDAAGDADDVQNAEIERLRALGYIQ